MADPKVDCSELDAAALTIFAQRAAAGRVGEAAAVDAYRQAEAFLSVRGRVRAGELSAKRPAGPQLADCCAPNLPETHPLNLVSQRFGDAAKVARAKKWLDANPTPVGDADDSKEFVGRFRRAFPDLNWQRDTLGETLASFTTARAIFPAYCAT